MCLIHYIEHMRTKTSRSPKLRDFICKVCKMKFQNYFSPSEIRLGNGKFCSRVCEGISRRKGKYINCRKCGKQFYISPSQAKIKHRGVFCGRRCYGSEKKERKMSTDGYWIVHLPNGDDIKEHRLVVEQSLGRKLLPTEIVHHVNHNPLDNRLENLQVVTRTEHNALHGRSKR